MDRRSFIASVGALAATSGCIGTGDTEDGHSEITVDDGEVVMTFNSMEERGYIEYYNPETDEIEKYHAENGKFAQPLFFVGYRGGGSLDVEKVTDVTMAGGDVHHEITELPFRKDKIRDRDFTHPERELYRRGEKILPQGRKPLTFLFDVPTDVEDVFWEYDGTEYLMVPEY